MLLCEHLDVQYGHVPALRDVSLAVRPDEMVALIGPNGAGKTTTLATIVGLLRPTRGSVSFGGKTLTGLDPADVVTGGVALVPQGRMIFYSLTVRENLRMGGYRFSEPGVVRARQGVVLEIFPALKDRLNQLGGTLSGGEQQMLAIGRALMSDPSLLLLDEPSTGLAPKLVESIFRTLFDLHRGGTMILLVEQNVRIALSLATRGYVMEAGSIVAEGSASALSTDARLVEAYLG
ncbi:MAG: ABC transporter ATP-binding protein [Armatimonadota bacterium]